MARIRGSEGDVTLENAVQRGDAKEQKIAEEKLANPKSPNG